MSMIFNMDIVLHKGGFAMKRTGWILGFVVIALAISFPCSAQEWAKVYGSGDTVGSWSAMGTTDDGYVVAGGYYGEEDIDFWVLQLNSSGEIIWQKRYGPSGNLNDDFAASIQQTGDGGYIVGGSSWSFGGGHNYDYWVLKLDVIGNIVWQKAFGGTNGGEWDQIYSLQQTQDGGYIIAGSSGSFPQPDPQPQIWLLKLDGGGNIVWQKTYDSYGQDRACSVLQTTNGGYILATGTYSPDGAGGEDLWVLKLDANGNVGPSYPDTWQKFYGGSISDGVYVGKIAIQQTLDNGYIVAGETFSFGQGYTDVWVLKLDSDGNVSWEKAYGTDICAEGASSVVQSADGGYLVAGYSVRWGTGSSGYNYLLLKLDSFGNITWQKIYGGDKWDRAGSVLQTTDGHYVVAGGTQSFGLAGLLLRLDENGEAPDGCRIEDTGQCLVVDTSAVVTDAFVVPQTTAITPRTTNVTPTNTYATADEVCPSPDIEVSPLSHDYGDVLLGTSNTATVNITNAGETDLTITDLTFTNGGKNAFFVTSSPGLPVVLPPVASDPVNGSIDIEITFTPPSHYYYYDYLEIVSDDPYDSLVEVLVRGTGVEVPLANFIGNPNSGPAPLTVQFTDLSSGSVDTWQWDFDNNGTVDSTAERPDPWNYTEVGDYTVSLTVTGPAGQDTETKIAYIHAFEPTPPVAAFTANETSGEKPLTVQFTDQSTGDVTSWSWSFGDTGTSTLQNPPHTYTDDGDFTVSLTVNGPGGSDTETKTDYIHVSPPSICSCAFVPDNTVVQRGGTLGFQASVTNNTGGTGTVLFGTKVTKPDASQTGFIWGPIQVYLNPHQTKSGHKTHTIPTGFALGTYTYHGYVGRFGTIYDECAFNFDVVP
jgi:PKD repeat protein